MNRLASFLRTLADRIDYGGAPKGTGWSFTIESGEGIRFNQSGRGCPLWYLGDADHERAHAEARRPLLGDGDGTEHGVRLPDGSTLYHRPWRGWEHIPVSQPFLKRPERGRLHRPAISNQRQERQLMKEMDAAARAAGVEVTGRCLLLFGDQAEISIPGEAEPVRWPAAVVADETGVPVKELPGRLLVFTLSESPECGRELRGFRLA